MRILLSLAAVMVVLLPVAFAENLNGLRSAASLEKENAVISFLGLHDRDGDRNRDHGRGDRHDHDRDHGDRDHYRRPPPPPPRYDVYTCFAENRRGELFRARDYSARWAQQEALEACYRYSNSCRALGCRR